MAEQHSIAQTKTQLSQLLKKVKSGEEITVTERGAPIAKIIPFEPMDFEERIKFLEAKGAIIPSKNRKKKWKWPEVKVRPGAVARFLKDR